MSKCFQRVFAKRYGKTYFTPIENIKNSTWALLVQTQFLLFAVEIVLFQRCGLR